MPKLPGYLKTALKLALTGLAFWLVFRKLEARQLWAVLSNTRIGWLLVATLLFVGSKVLSAARLRALFEAGGISLRVDFNLRLYWLGMFYNLFLPGGIGGDGYKVYYLNRLTGVGVKPLITATLLDRIIGLLPVLSLSLLLIWLAWSQTIPGWRLPTLTLGRISIPTWLALVSITIIHLTAAWGMHSYFPCFAPMLNRATAQSLGVQVLQCLSIWVLCLSIGAEGPVMAYQLVFLVSSVVAAFPLTVGGAGARELTFMAGAHYLGLPVEAAVAISLLFYGITALVSLSGAYYTWNESLLHYHT